MPQPPLPLPPPTATATATASRARALKKLGLTEEDVHFSKKLFSEISSACSNGTTSTTACSKAERLLGYTETRLKRAKALKLLGATEDDIEVECQKNLGSLGHGGRRRSFVMEMDPARNSRLHRRLSLGSSIQRRTFFGTNSRRKKARSGAGSGRDRFKSLPHSRRRRGSSSRLSSTTGSRRYTQ